MKPFIMPAVVALVATNFGAAGAPPPAYGLVASAGAIAVAVGPLVGGLLTTYASWRWVFAGEVVIVLCILALAALADGGLRRRPRCPARPGRDGPLSRRIGHGRLRHRPLRDVGLRAAPNPTPRSGSGHPPVIWLLLGGAGVLALLRGLGRAGSRRRAGLPSSIRVRPPRPLQAGLTAFFFRFLLQAGLFFVVPLFLSVALGLSAVATGVRLLPLSFTLLVAAVGVPQSVPRCVASPGHPHRFFPPAPRHRRAARRVGCRCGAQNHHVAHAAGRTRHREPGLATRGGHGARRCPSRGPGTSAGSRTPLRTWAHPSARPWPGLSSSRVDDDLPRRGCRQPGHPQGDVLAGPGGAVAGIPIVSDADLRTTLEKAGVAPATATVIVDVNTSSRINGLRAALAVLAVPRLLVALVLTCRLPVVQPKNALADGDEEEGAAGAGGGGGPERALTDDLRSAGA